MLSKLTLVFHRHKLCVKNTNGIDDNMSRVLYKINISKRFGRHSSVANECIKIPLLLLLLIQESAKPE